jgi:hypothetical protein
MQTSFSSHLLASNPKEVTVGTHSQLFDVAMDEASMVLNEVVVTALGIKRESKSLGYSATSVATNRSGDK